MSDPDQQVAAAAASVLLLWPETRRAAKQVLIETIENETDSVEQARRILEFGVYATTDDIPTFEHWLTSNRLPEMRAATALAWAWTVNPGPLPQAVVAAIDELTEPDSDAIARLPWVGVWQRGSWSLPANAAELILRLIDNRDKELRWRAVQGLTFEHETAKSLPNGRVIPVLIRKLSGDYGRICGAAAYALAQRSESVLLIAPDVVPTLIIRPHSR